jgi:ribonuclease P protein subunit RPR2
MRRRTGKDKTIQRKIAARRIAILFQLAQDCAVSGRFSLADRYVELARNISMRYLVPIPVEFKRWYCKQCYGFLLPGVNSRVRISRGKVIYTCLRCQRQTRMPLHPRKTTIKTQETKVK